MKKISLWVVAAGLAGALGSVAMAQQDVVTSVNIVGYQKYTFERGQLYLVATAFEDIDGKDRRAVDVFGLTQLPPRTQISFYNAELNPAAYQTENKNVLAWQPGPTGPIIFRGGMAFWVKIPADAPAGTGPNGSYEVVLMGQVPMDKSTKNVAVRGLNMMGFPYTADVKFTDTAIHSNALPGDVISFYDSTIGYYKYTRNVNKTWARFNTTVPYTNLIIRQNLGFWYKTNNTTNLFNEKRPY